MEYLKDQMWSTLFASLCTLLLIWVAYIFVGFVDKMVITPLRIKRIMNKQGVKGPSAYWLVGNIPDLFRESRAEVRKQMKTGDYDIMSHVLPYDAQNCQAYAWEATMRIIELDLIKQVLANNDAFIQPKLLSSIFKELVGKSIGTTKGEEWALHCQIVNPAFHQEKIKAMVPVMEKSALSMANEWEDKVKNGGGQVEVSDYITHVTVDILARTTFGSSYEKEKKVFEHQHKLFTLVTQRMKFVAIPGYSILPTPLNVKILVNQIIISTTLKEIIQSRKDMVNMTKNASYGNDLLGLMLIATMEETLVKGGKICFGMQQLMDNCKTFFLARHETTATLLTWTMMLLASHTTWQELARVEVIKVCGHGDHPRGANMLNKLKTLTMILNEAIRLFPPVVDQHRQAIMDIKLRDLNIPKGLLIYFPMLAIHHDHELWGANIHKFEPKRFVNGVAKATRHPLAFMPFSFTPRFCVGQGFALEEEKSILVVILQRFRFHLSANYCHTPCAFGTLTPIYGMAVILECL